MLLVTTFLAMAVISICTLAAQDVAKAQVDMRTDQAFVRRVCEALKKTQASKRGEVAISKTVTGGVYEAVSSTTAPNDATWNQALRIVELVFKQGPLDTKSFGAKVPANWLKIKAGEIEVSIPIVRNPEHKDESFDVSGELGKILALIEESNKAKAAR